MQTPKRMGSETMRSNEPTVFLVWEFNEVPNIDLGDKPHGIYQCPPHLADLLSTTHQEAQLRAIDTTCTQAVQHKKFLEKKNPPTPTHFYRVESCSANHLFAESQLGSLNRINKRGTRQE